MWWHGPEVTRWGYALTMVSMVLLWQLAVFGVIVLIGRLGRLNQPVAERPPAPSHLPSGSPAASSTSMSTDSIDGVSTHCEDCSQPATRSQRRSLKLVSSV